MSAHPWLGIASILTTFIAVMLVLRALQRRYHVDAEWTRKFLHVSMGLVALCAPCLFDANWPVILLAAAFALFFTALKLTPFVKRSFGGVLAVERDSLGEICFPIAIGLLFMLADKKSILFYVPVLILTFPDAAAALVGRRYGRMRYQNCAGSKSLEGSLAFLAVVFPTTYISLLLFGHPGGMETVFITVTLSLLLTVIEAISMKGMDNLFLPLGAFFLLEAFLRMEGSRIAAHLGVAALLFSFFAYVFLRPFRSSPKFSGDSF